MTYDITLIMVPPWETKRAPLGLAYISEYLKFCGFATKVIDFNLNLYQSTNEYNRIFWKIHNINFMPLPEITNRMFNIFKNKIDGLVDEILSFDTKFVGFSVNIASIGLAGKIATLIKKKDRGKFIIFGGTGCYWECDRSHLSPEDIHSIDTFVIGEGEEVLEKIIKRSPKGLEDLENIEGVVYKKEDFFKPATPYYTKDIDKLPFPKFSEYDLKGYTENQVPLVTSRSCIGRCVYCIDHLMCGPYRFRSPEKVLEEIKYHINVNKMNNIALNDLICNGNLKQLEKICDLIIDNQIKISWESYAMVRKDMDLELLKKMHKAGCVFLCYGLESGCDRTLKRMNKFYNSEVAQRLIRATNEAGIQTAINIIVGFPGETKEDFGDTVAFIKRNKEYITEITNVSTFVIMPPSKIGAHPFDYGIKFPFIGNPYLYIDENGVDVNERIKRLRKTLFVVNMLDIRNVIVNQPGLEMHTDKGCIALLSLPPARIDTPSSKIAKLHSYLRIKKLNPIIYDFNIKLYHSVSQELKDLWSYQNWHLWNFFHKILSISDSLENVIFDLINEIIFLRTNVFYFCINRENLFFSIKIASILKKWIPSILVIFGSSIFKNMKILELIPAGTVDILVVDQEEETLCRILENIDEDVMGIPNTIIYKNGTYQCNNEREYDTMLKLTVNFDGFNLKEYNNLRLPLLWNQKTNRYKSDE